MQSYSCWMAIIISQKKIILGADERNWFTSRSYQKSDRLLCLIGKMVNSIKNENLNYISLDMFQLCEPVPSARP